MSVFGGVLPFVGFSTRLLTGDEFDSEYDFVWVKSFDIGWFNRYFGMVYKVEEFDVDPRTKEELLKAMELED